MKASRVGLLMAAALLLGAEHHVARASAPCLSIAGSAAAPVPLGTTLNFAAQCCSSVPAISNRAWLLVGLLVLLSIGVLAVRRVTRFVSGLLLSCVVTFFSRPAQGQSCGGPFQWQAQSASEKFTGTGPRFSFTPTLSGTFTVSLSDASEAAAPIAFQVSSGDGGTVSGNTPSTLFLLGTGGAAGGPGPDGQYDQYWTGSAWASVPSLPSKIGVFLASATWEPNTALFYLFGSRDGTKNAVTYNPATKTWASIADLSPNSGNYVIGTVGGAGAACALTGIIYLFGGNSPGNATTATVLSYNPKTDSYTTLNDYPNQWSGINGVTSTFGCTANGVIYVGGGTDGGSRAATTWYRYNQASDTYTSLASLPTGLLAAGAAYFDGSIYVIAGATLSNGTGANGVYRYSISANSWTTLKNYPTSAGYLCPAIWNGTLYGLGGISSAGYPSMVSGVYKYDPGSDSWSLHSTLPVGMAGAVAGYTGQ